MSYLEEPLLGENKGETKEVFLTPKVYIRVGAVFFFFQWLIVLKFCCGDNFISQLCGLKLVCRIC